MTVDMTFCASPTCTNECGRKMQPEQKAFLDKYPNKPVAYSYFCGGEPHHGMPKDINCQHEYKHTLAKSGMWLENMCHKCGHIRSLLEDLEARDA